MSAIEGAVCTACERTWAPAPARCPACGGAVRRVNLTTEGNLLSFTTVASAPEGFASGYALAVIQLGSAIVMARLAEGAPRALKIGSRARVREGRLGLEFEPAAERDQGTT